MSGMELRLDEGESDQTVVLWAAGGLRGDRCVLSLTGCLNQTLMYG